MTENWMPQIAEGTGWPDETHIVGAILLMEIVNGNHLGPVPIGALYSQVLTAVRQSRVCLAVDDGGQPIGYAIWEGRPDGPRITRHLAPFGDHPALFDALRSHLPAGARADHPDSARPVQEVF